MCWNLSSTVYWDTTHTHARTSLTSVSAVVLNARLKAKSAIYRHSKLAAFRIFLEPRIDVIDIGSCIRVEVP